MASRIQSFIPIFRILRYNKYIYFPEKRIPSREFSSILPNKDLEIKYDELRSRLAEVPYVNLIDNEADRVLEELCNENDKGLEDVLKWFTKVFNYNVRNNETLYPTNLLKSFCTYGFGMDDPSWKHWDSAAWRSAATVAWCVKMIVASYNIIDDIMDHSVLRNFEPCWYTRPDVGLTAVNDFMLLQFGINKLLKSNFANSKCYIHLLQEFLKATHDTVYGQCMMGRYTSRNLKQRFDNFGFEQYETLVKYKTQFAFSLPVLLGMHLAGKCTPKDYDFAKKLCLRLGLYIQMQDDYADCFGNNEMKISGMMGSDISEGYLTWFSVKFLEQSSEPMKKQFLENYGVDNKDAIEKVLELYSKANLLAKFEESDRQLYKEISTLIESMNDVKGYLFYDLFAETQKRER